MLRSIYDNSIIVLLAGLLFGTFWGQVLPYWRTHPIPQAQLLSGIAVFVVLPAAYVLGLLVLNLHFSGVLLNQHSLGILIVFAFLTLAWTACFKWLFPYLQRHPLFYPKVN